jgi:hypothetical protein
MKRPDFASQNPMRLSLQEREYAGSFSAVCGNSNVTLSETRQRDLRRIPHPAE